MSNVIVLADVREARIKAEQDRKTRIERAQEARRQAPAVHRGDETPKRPQGGEGD